MNREVEMEEKGVGGRETVAPLAKTMQISCKKTELREQ